MTYIALILVNLLSLYFLNSANKYWLLSIPLWTVLLSCFILWRITSDRRMQTLETIYWKSTQNRTYGDFNKWNALEQHQAEAQRRNLVFIYAIALQTFITFIFQIIGRSRTRLRYYRTTRLLFGILLALAVLLVGLMGIVPTGPLI